MFDKMKVKERDHRLPTVATAAYLSALLFALRLTTFFIPAVREATALNSPVLGELNCLLGITPHLLLFPVIAALPAPAWAKAAGWGWLVVDIATDIMTLNGVAASIDLSLKYGGHISATLWVVVASWQAKGTARLCGLLLALNLGSYSFLAAFVPAVALAPSLVLLPGWLGLVGRRLVQEARRTGV
jgi:hypothetical protein